MSVYMEFFIRTPDDKFILIDEICRTSTLYTALEFEAPYEAIARLTPDVIAAARKRIEVEIEDLKGYKKWLKGSGAADTPEEHWEKIRNTKEELASWKYARSKLDVFDDLDGYNPVYMGIEISCPTVEDVRE